MSSDQTDGSGSASSIALFIGMGFVLLLSGGIWFIRPWLHGIVYWVYTTPLLWIGIPLCLGFGVTIRAKVGSGSTSSITVICIIGLFALSTVSGTFAANTLGQATMADSQSIDQLHNTEPTQPRILPESVADRYASNTLDFPKYQTSDGDITIHNGTPHWSYALSPDGTWNQLTRQQHGTVMIDMSSQNAAVSTTTGDLKKGIGTAFYNNYRWQLLKHEQYLADYADPFMVLHEDNQYIAVPYTKPQFHWTPLPHTTPKWSGVMLVDETGETTDLSPEEARNHPALKDQKLYPFELTRERVTATKYRNGILNTYTSHDEEIELAPVPGDGNDQPFLMSTTDGPTYAVAAEPYGDAQGLTEIWLVDARTGQYHRYTPNGSMFGPRKATDYVRQAARTTDWDRFTPSEPLPVVIDEQLYWQVRVVPTDNSGLSYIAFVNAQTSDVQEVESTAAVTNFLENTDVPTNQTRGQNTSESTASPSMIVKRVAPNGTVIGTMTIHDNESVQIIQNNTTSN